MSKSVCKHTISIAAEDTDIEKWIQMQRNLSASIRTIIENEIYMRGFVDATSVPLRERINQTVSMNGSMDEKQEIYPKTVKEKKLETDDQQAANNLLDSLM